MAYSNNANDIYGGAPTMTSRMHGTRFGSVLDDRQGNAMLGEASSRMSSHPTVSVDDQRNVYITDSASYQSYSGSSLSSRFSGSSGMSSGAAPTQMTGRSVGRSRLSRVSEDLIGATPSVTSDQSTQGRRSGTTTRSTYSRPQNSPSAPSNTSHTTSARRPLETQSHKYVTPEAHSSHVTDSSSYQSHYRQEISTNFSSDEETVPMGVGEATIDLISNTGSSLWTLGRELFQRR